MSIFMKIFDKLHCTSIVCSCTCESINVYVRPDIMLQEVRFIQITSCLSCDTDLYMLLIFE